jgi:hypothetical protein
MFMGLSMARLHRCSCGDELVREVVRALLVLVADTVAQKIAQGWWWLMRGVTMSLAVAHGIT